jgi:threonine dehydrogenase-like Zn-dependent dehydrogenase
VKLVSMAGWSFGIVVLAAGLVLAASAVSSEDSNFLKSAANGGMAEVELGRLATQKASKPKHMHRYLKPLLIRIESEEIDPSFVITHRVALDDAPKMYKTFRDKEDGCIKVVLKAHAA